MTIIKSKRRRKPKGGGMFMWMKMAAVGVSVGSAAIGGTWATSEYMHSNLAWKADVKAIQDEAIIAGYKADFVLDQLISQLVAQIAYLENKKNKTRDEIEQLRSLRQQLEIQRKVRKGK